MEFKSAYHRHLHEVANPITASTLPQWILDGHDLPPEVAPVPLPLPDWVDQLGEVPLRQLLPPPETPAASLRRLHRPSGHQRFLRLVRPFWRARLKRNIRAWLPAACKDPRSVEAEFVANWSFELRFIFGE
jgi:hypothetical protein